MRSPPNPEIDLGLAIAGATLKPRQTRSRVELAAYAGCSKQYIEQIEINALRKLRHLVLFDSTLKSHFRP
jgi:DNA-directed RNA polymerase sigma subunit (sigma70/sigma32)